MPMTLESYAHADSNRMTVAVTIDRHEMAVGDAIISEIVRQVATRYVAENYPTLIASLDQQAIANLAIAESGKHIAEEIRMRPVVLQPKGDRIVVNKRSIF